MMKQTAVCIALMMGFSVAAIGEESRPRPKVASPPPASGYKLDLNTGLSPSNTPVPPPGTSTLTKEDNGPFLGLKLTKPLGN